MDSKQLQTVTSILVIVGALNWGLVGLLGLNLVELLLGSIPLLEKLVYILVGLSGVYMASTNKMFSKNWGTSSKKK